MSKRAKLAGASRRRRVETSETSMPVSELSGMRKEMVVLSELILDAGTQPRAAFDEAAIEEYSERMAISEGLEGIRDSDTELWPNIIVFESGTDKWLADGFHRVRAARIAGFESFQAQIIPGDRLAAIEHSLRVNHKHGIRRTREDKRNAVRRAFVDLGMDTESNQQIATLCGVSPTFVSKMRDLLLENAQIQPTLVRVGADGVEHDVSTRTRSTRSTSGTKLRVESLEDQEGRVRFSELDSKSELSLVSTLVATPSEPTHYGVLLDHLPRLLGTTGALIIVLPQGQVHLADLSRVTDFMNEAPVLSVLTSEKRVIFSWRADVKLAASTLGTLLPHDSSTLYVV